MKLELTVRDDKHGSYKIDMTGLLVFFLALLSSPVIWMFSGFGFSSILMMLIGVTGLVHFVVVFFLTILPFVKADMKADKEKQEQETSNGS